MVAFHRRLPGYEATPFVSLIRLAEARGVGGKTVRDEATRFGLKAFKALGGSYATARLLTGPLKAISPAFGIVGLAFLFMRLLGGMGIMVFGLIGHRRTERMIAYPGLLWLVGFGG